MTMIVVVRQRRLRGREQVRMAVYQDLQRSRAYGFGPIVRITGNDLLVASGSAESLASRKRALEQGCYYSREQRGRVCLSTKLTIKIRLDFIQLLVYSYSMHWQSSNNKEGKTFLDR